MHYCTIVITKEFPTDDVLSKALAPFNEEEYYASEGTIPRPIFTWDYWIIGGRYSGSIKLTVDKNNEEYEWPYMANKSRAGRLFRSSMLEMIEHLMKQSRYSYYNEEEFFGNMGFDDGFLYVDACKIKDIKNLDKLTCYSFIDKTGKGFTRSYFDGEEFIDNSNFDEQFKEALQNSQDCYACIVDLHD